MVVNLASGETVYARVDPSLLGRIMEVLAPEELGEVANAMVDAVENPDSRTLCQALKDDGQSLFLSRWCSFLGGLFLRCILESLCLLFLHQLDVLLGRHRGTGLGSFGRQVVTRYRGDQDRQKQDVDIGAVTLSCHELDVNSLARLWSRYCGDTQGARPFTVVA